MVPAADVLSDRKAAGFVGKTDMETIADRQAERRGRGGALNHAGLIGCTEHQISGIVHAEPFGHLLTPRHVARAQDWGLGPGA